MVFAVNRKSLEVLTVGMPSNPLSNPKGGHFGAFWHTGLDKKNAQNVGFEHFGTFWHPGLAEREGFEPNAPICSISIIYTDSFR